MLKRPKFFSDSRKVVSSEAVKHQKWGTWPFKEKKFSKNRLEFGQNWAIVTISICHSYFKGVDNILYTDYTQNFLIITITLDW